MCRHKKVTSESINYVKQQVAAGVTREALAVELGLHVVTVYKMARAAAPIAPELFDIDKEYRQWFGYESYENRSYAR